ncbi:MAG: hypothetical protein JEZ00_01370 [Anaerolineaceae bacterium]|nr:hypothetical protein [Anaerolineaceae bacterium]
MKTNRIFWGISIMLFGGVMLLKTMGIFSFNIWRIMGPGFLILIGVWFIYNAMVNPKPSAPESLTIPVEGAEEIVLNLAHGAGKLQLKAANDAYHLLSGKFNNGIDSSVNRIGSVAEISLKPFSDPVDFVMPGNFHGVNWDMEINPDLPTSIELKAGANESILNLTKVNIKKLDISTGASKTDVYFSEKASYCTANISAGVAEVSLHIPSNVAANISVQGKELSSIKIDTNRFVQHGDNYQSTDYTTSENKLDIQVKPGLGEINIS